MGAISKWLGKTHGGYCHWCPACESIHIYTTNNPQPNGARWQFNGNVERPSFTPSMKITWGIYTPGDVEECCHYFLTDGKINYCPDCTHKLAGQSVDLPELPDTYKDFT